MKIDVPFCAQLKSNSPLTHYIFMGAKHATFRRRHKCLSLSCVLCVVRGSALRRSLVQRGSIECGMSWLCSWNLSIEAAWAQVGCWTTKRKLRNNDADSNQRHVLSSRQILRLSRKFGQSKRKEIRRNCSHCLTRNLKFSRQGIWRTLTSGMWHRLVWCKCTTVSENPVVCITVIDDHSLVIEAAVPSGPGDSPTSLTHLNICKLLPHYTVSHPRSPKSSFLNMF
jgi:hypothetical protein